MWQEYRVITDPASTFATGTFGTYDGALRRGKSYVKHQRSIDEGAPSGIATSEPTFRIQRREVTEWKDVNERVGQAR